jgi:hypothetical protein
MVWTRAGGVVVAMAMVVGGVVSLVAQTPKPFPSPGQPPPAPVPGTPATPGRPAPSGPAEATPTETTLGAPIFPNAHFITSYDAGRGQRFYLYGATAAFLDVVTFYRTSLKQRGEVLFEQPPTHQFETGRFRDETMAFPPSVTIKDYTFGGSSGYPNPKAGAQPPRFSTVIQIVPAPPGTPQE